MAEVFDIAIVGGGFYGCCLALYLADKKRSVVLFEKEPILMSRASAINQARVHSGFHYPRSLTTALRSLVNFPRFVYEFRDAIVDDFTMCYAIARHGSKVNAQRFWRMYTDMKAPIKPASPTMKGLFASSMIENVFACQEYAFNHDLLRDILEHRLKQRSVEVRRETEIIKAQSIANNQTRLTDTHQKSVHATHIFNCTYSRINVFLEQSNLEPLALKHELTEMLLIESPEELHGLAVTVMDGAFFSLMPYPSRSAYTLSHVRYTPHAQWHDNKPCIDGHKVLQHYHKKSHMPFMLRDVQRFMPDLTLHFRESLFEIKTVLQRNEIDDGRPIFYRTHPELGNVHTVMGSKIDNVYDLLEALGDIAAPIKKHSPKNTTSRFFS